ncbi:MAG: NmrA family NAD(P)-binding protein [Deltaproteobacteria bacterium]|nr:NmrA family NAD(P)-binding protein [Deltaproteobacteria bacterium]
MSTVLVVGASGQLGSTIVAALLEAGHRPHALLRENATLPEGLAEHVDVEVCRGDLGDLSSLHAACSRADVVISTASAIMPKKGDRFGADEVAHYENLLTACGQQRVEHFIYISAFSTVDDDLVPEFVIKRQIEGLIAASGLRYTIFRAAAFMDIYFAAMGSEAPLRGVRKPTLKRGFWLTRLFLALSSGLLERRGVALVPGKGSTVHRFISIKSVAVFMVRAVDLPGGANRTLELAGPQSLCWDDIVSIYARQLGRRVRCLHLPIWLFKVLAVLMARVSPAGANMMRIFAMLGTHDYNPAPSPALHAFCLPLEQAEEYITRQLAQPLREASREPR